MEKQNTPIGNIIKRLENRISDLTLINSGADYRTLDFTISRVIEELERQLKFIKSMLPTERETIETSYNDGKERGNFEKRIFVHYESPSDYFTQTFKTQDDE